MGCDGARRWVAMDGLVVRGGAVWCVVVVRSGGVSWCLVVVVRGVGCRWCGVVRGGDAWWCVAECVAECVVVQCGAWWWCVVEMRGGDARRCVVVGRPPMV